MQVHPRKLVVRHRSKSSSSDYNSTAAAASLFVRLHPTTAQALWQDAMAGKDNDGDDSFAANDDGYCWNVTKEKALSTQVSSGIEFLPLRVQKTSQDVSDEDEIVFCSYNGGDIAQDNAIELPPSLLPQESFVLVSVVPSVRVAKKVTVETVRASDWQQLARHSDWLEAGGLLQQVSLVYSHQQVQIALPDGSVARARIMSMVDENDDQHDSVWPSQQQQDNATHRHNAFFPPCRRIVADTELVLMSGAAKEDDLPTFELQAAKEEYTRSMQHFHAALNKAPPLVSCSRGTAALHISRWSNSENHSHVRVAMVGSDNSYDDAVQDFLDCSFLQVECSELVDPKCIVLHPLTRLSLGLALEGGKVSVEKILPIEWEQARTSDISVEHDVDFRSVKFVQSQHNYRRARILSSNMLQFDESIVNACRHESVPVGSFVAVPQQTGAEPRVLRIVLKSAENFRYAVKHDDKHTCVRQEDLLHRLLDWRPNAGTKTEEIHLREFVNFLPQSSVPTQKLMVLEPKMLQNKSVILAGKSGSGKTHAALMLAAMSHFLTGRRLVYVDCVAVKNLRRMMDILDALRDAISEAVDRESIVVLDDLHELIIHDQFEASQGGAQVQQPNWAEMEQSKLIRDHVQQLLSKASGDLNVVITCETAGIASAIIPAKSRQTTLQLPLFDSAERMDLLTSLLRSRAERFDKEFEESFRHVLASVDFDGASRSYLPVDLCTLSLRVEKSMDAIDWDAGKLSDIVKSEFDRFVPVSRDAASLENATSKANWDQVGGLFQAKEDLLDAVFRPSLYRRIYERSRVRLPRGIMLFGPSGCGKSFLVPALARYCRLPLVMCRGPELLDRYIGGSEARVRELFSRAFLAAPCILFLDEFDALAPKRGSDSTGVTDRVVNQLLTFLDGVEDLASAGTVYIVAATSLPDKIDPALLRPGRLEKHIYIGMPNSREEMIDVITKTARTYNLKAGALESFCSSYKWNGKSLSPADVRAAFQTAHLLAIRSRLERDPKNSSAHILLSESFLREGFSKVRPSLSDEDARWYRRLQERFSPTKKGSTNGSHDQETKSPLRTALR